MELLAPASFLTMSPSLNRVMGTLPVSSSATRTSAGMATAMRLFSTETASVLATTFLPTRRSLTSATPPALHAPGALTPARSARATSRWATTGAWNDTALPSMTTAASHSSSRAPTTVIPWSSASAQPPSSKRANMASVYSGSPASPQMTALRSGTFTAPAATSPPSRGSHDTALRAARSATPVRP